VFAADPAAFGVGLGRMVKCCFFDLFFSFSAAQPLRKLRRVCAALNFSFLKLAASRRSRGAGILRARSP
ncbi:MAG: hypothetical protein LBF34_00580, partial [Puniceicoccales bacterium]|nr:hypothetical protein [Puniceicoccales bacterium]